MIVPESQAIAAASKQACVQMLQPLKQHGRLNHAPARRRG